MEFGDKQFDRPDAMQIEIWKRMSPSQRLQCSEQLRVTAIKLHTSYIKETHPEISDTELKKKIHEFIHRGTG